MDDKDISRKEFFDSAARLCMGTCLCAVIGGSNPLMAEEKSENREKPAEKTRAEQRIEFAEQWVSRFMKVLDDNLDEATKLKVMMASGKACYLGWIKETNRQIKQRTFEQFADWVKTNVRDGSIRIEDKAIYMQYMTAAETGQEAPEGKCLCTLMETKPAGLSKTFCQCSIGYISAWYELMFGRRVNVELLDSVLYGGQRCQFKITLA